MLVKWTFFHTKISVPSTFIKQPIFHDFFHAGYMKYLHLFEFAHCSLPCSFLPRSGYTSMKQNQAENSLPSNSLIIFPATVSHDYSVISLALNNIFCPKKLSIRRVYFAVALFDSRQQKQGVHRIVQSSSTCKDKRSYRGKRKAELKGSGELTNKQ